MLYSRHGWAQCTTYFAVIRSLVRTYVRTYVLWTWKDTFQSRFELATTFRFFSIALQWNVNEFLPLSWQCTSLGSRER